MFLKNNTNTASTPVSEETTFQSFLYNIIQTHDYQNINAAVLRVLLGLFGLYLGAWLGIRYLYCIRNDKCKWGVILMVFFTLCASFLAFNVLSIVMPMHIIAIVIGWAIGFLIPWIVYSLYYRFSFRKRELEFPIGTSNI